jgi:hypothetical protein
MSSEDQLEQYKAALRTVSDEHDCDIVFYSGDIRHPGDDELVKLVKALRSRKNVFLFLTTPGGSPDCAYRIARCLQRAYSDGRFILFVDSFCKSAGTLIALGADEIVMSVMAELGPLDVQLSKPDALAEQTSGLTPTHAITTLCDQAFESVEKCFLDLRFKSGLQITTKTALEIATKLSTGLFAPIFQHIDPMRLGEISMAMLIAEEYGDRLARGNEQPGTIQRLISAYPSHSFVIDRDEASKLFRTVREPTDSESTLAQFIEPYVEEGLRSSSPLVEFLSVLVQDDEDSQNDIEGENSDDSNQSEAVQKTTGSEGDSPTEESISPEVTEERNEAPQRTRKAARRKAVE